MGAVEPPGRVARNASEHIGLRVTVGGTHVNIIFKPEGFRGHGHMGPVGQVQPPPGRPPSPE